MITVRAKEQSPMPERITIPKSKKWQISSFDDRSVGETHASAKRQYNSAKHCCVVIIYVMDIDIEYDIHHLEMILTIVPALGRETAGDGCR